ncbi:MAG: hypothetical protein E7374_02840 [Clostridiales bacterium]|nr:hypothetical protein [Clostridiales bacterium]
MKKTRKSKLKKVLLTFSIIIVSLFALISIITAVFYNKYSLDVDKLTSYNNGVIVVSENSNENSLFNTTRSIIEIESLPNYVSNAFVAIEDKRFYSHNGFDFLRILKAGFINFTSNSKQQGASTISQQLVKNALLTNEKTYARKVKELVLAHKMEKKFSKKEILEMYLNTIYFGSNAYGIENASLVYFNKSAKDLTLNEACTLAGLIKSPAYYSPINNYENCIKRRNLVAKEMLKQKFINKTDYNNLINSDITLSFSHNHNNSYEQVAIHEACSLLNMSERELINAKYKIITYKDENLQNQIISSSNQVKDRNLDSLSVVLSNEGHVLAYYSNSYYNLHNLQRQPASTLKPLAVYLPCIEENLLSPATKILDEEINYSGYSPKNADGNYHGYVSVRDSLAYSHNIPSVKALDYVGLKKAKETLTKFDIHLNNSDLNLALALGSTKNGVNLLNLAKAYSILANQGTTHGLTFVKKIETNEGLVIYENKGYSEKLFNEEDCFLVNDMLKTCAEKGSAKRLSSLNLPVCSKTGTASVNEKNTDLYNIAYTSEHTVLTWIANLKDKFLPNDMKSSNEPTQINYEILSYLYKSNKPKDFAVPESVSKLPFDLNEYETNNLVVSPSSDLDRYTLYDYFKTSNPPPQNTQKSENLNVILSENGALISFETKKYNSYKLIKTANNKSSDLLKLSNTNEQISYLDENVFKYETINYKLIDSNKDIILSECTIKPKEYLIGLLDSKINSAKKKWYV